MILIKYYCSVVLLGLFVVMGCTRQPVKNGVVTSFSRTLLDVCHMPALVPDDLQGQLAWGLWKLDRRVIEAAIVAGASPYDLTSSVTGLPYLPADKQLSPYTLILEGYLDLTYLEEDPENIYSALDQLYSCIECLLSHQISPDYGILTFGTYKSMREYVYESLKRLHTDVSLDAEGEYAVLILERIQKLMNEI